VREARLRVDAERDLPGFQLEASLRVGTEVMVLFGPSGAGKTMLLDLVAGLTPADSGDIMLDGTTFLRRGRPGPAVNLPARERRVGYVLQAYALFPHMTALGNVAYALRRRPDGGARARQLLERVSMAHLADRYPAELSGGQQQRVALARALATGSPLLLLDEPFAALDGAMRTRLQHDLRQLQRELELVMVLVTHQLEDAFAMGDRIAVMRGGRIEQVGPIADVFRRPATRGVAEIMGIRNLIRARVAGTGAATSLDWDGLVLEAGPSAARPGDDVTAYIRPEDIKILYPDRPLTPAVSGNVFDAVILLVRPHASMRIAEVELPNGSQLEVRFPDLSYASLRLEPGARVRVALRRDGLVILGERERGEGDALVPATRSLRP
jgi:molybdate transport system ATP-binding protein